MGWTNPWMTMATCMYVSHHMVALGWKTTCMLMHRAQIPRPVRTDRPLCCRRCGFLPCSEVSLKMASVVHWERSGAPRLSARTKMAAQIKVQPRFAIRRWGPVKLSCHLRSLVKVQFRSDAPGRPLCPSSSAAVQNRRLKMNSVSRVWCVLILGFVASASAQNDLTDDQRDFIKFDTNFDGKLDAQELRIGL